MLKLIKINTGGDERKFDKQEMMDKSILKIAPLNKFPFLLQKINQKQGNTLFCLDKNSQVVFSSDPC